jgi:hypothetical protein
LLTTPARTGVRCEAAISWFGVGGVPAPETAAAQRRPIQPCPPPSRLKASPSKARPSRKDHPSSRACSLARKWLTRPVTLGASCRRAE